MQISCFLKLQKPISAVPLIAAPIRSNILSRNQTSYVLEATPDSISAIKDKDLGSGRTNRATRAAFSHKNTGPLIPWGPLKVLQIPNSSGVGVADRGPCLRQERGNIGRRSVQAPAPSA